MGAVFDILHPSFKSALQRADEYLPADMCLKLRRGAQRVGGAGGDRKRLHHSRDENWNYLRKQKLCAT